jgi:hypothetical protein
MRVGRLSAAAPAKSFGVSGRTFCAATRHGSGQGDNRQLAPKLSPDDRYNAQRLCARKARPILIWAGSNAGTRRVARMAHLAQRDAALIIHGVSR